MPINVIVACKKDVVRSGLRRLLDVQKDISVVGEAVNFAGTDGLVATLNPDVSIVEMGLVAQPGSQGMEESLRAWLGTRVIVFSLRKNREYVEHCLDAGARGFVLAELLGSEIVDAVRQVYGGQLYLSAQVAS